MAYLFVYGTLGPGQAKESLVTQASGHWHPAHVQGDIVRITCEDGGVYSALRLAKGGRTVSGFVYQSDELDKCWAELDAYEGQMYRRIQSLVTLSYGEDVTAYMYVLKQ